jgi:hypothetical protein
MTIAYDFGCTLWLKKFDFSLKVHVLVVGVQVSHYNA